MTNKFDDSFGLELLNNYLGYLHRKLNDATFYFSQSTNYCCSQLYSCVPPMDSFINTVSEYKLKEQNVIYQEFMRVL